MNGSGPSSRRATALVFVLVVVAIMALISLTFARLMLAQRESALVYGRRLQAVAAAESGLEVVKQLLALDQSSRQAVGGIFDNPAKLAEVMVTDDASMPGPIYFSIVAPRIEEGGSSGLRSGLVNESAKINLNALLAADTLSTNGARQMLMALPAMTPDIADAILDWVDPDDQPRPFGAEASYYSSLDSPYAPANGPLTTVDELLLVRGVTPELLFGSDINRSGMVDPNEPQTTMAGGAQDPDGALDVGWSHFVTTYSMEANVRPDGQPKTNLNNSNLKKLHEDLKKSLGAEIATFIVAFRQHGPYEGKEPARSASDFELDLTQSPRIQLKSILDLVGVNVQVPPTEENRPPEILQSPFPNKTESMGSYLPSLLDHTTVGAGPTIAGRININMAPRLVLLAIPGMSELLADQIITQRDIELSAERADRRYATWILVDGLVKLEDMKNLMPLITTGGSVYRCQVVGYADVRGPTARIEVVLSTAGPAVELLFFRDLSYLGPG